MAQDYTVSAVVKDETWDGKDDRMRTVELALEGVGQTVESIGLAKFNPPSQGDTIHGEIDGNRFRFKKRGSAPQSASNGSSGQGRMDATGRSIERQVAAKCATDIVCARLASGAPGSDRPEFVQNFHFLVDTIADAIQNEGSKSDEDIAW